MSLDLSLIIPCYNEATHLRESVVALLKTLDGARLEYEVVFVDDHSQDATREILQEICASSDRCRAIHHDQNRGRGAAFKTGFVATDGPVAGFIDIDLEIQQGERVGLIGRNGAGKSTLLKVLSRITEPTKGKFSLNGSVACLLEVGTGFHQELTGRENIFLNGAILGMRKKEIKAKFDEIVDFAEVEKFLDTPVKHYSSGMQVRLAFAVAAHLESDIFIVDEVLAVGNNQNIVKFSEYIF